MIRISIVSTVDKLTPVLDNSDQVMLGKTSPLLDVRSPVLFWPQGCRPPSRVPRRIVFDKESCHVTFHIRLARLLLQAGLPGVLEVWRLCLVQKGFCFVCRRFQSAFQTLVRTSDTCFMSTKQCYTGLVPAVMAERKLSNDPLTFSTARYKMSLADFL